MTDYTAPCPHDPIETIAPDIFMVRGAMQMNPIVRISRNMGIVRHDGDLTLVNPIRLTPQGEDALRSLGTVKRLMRLGSFHGIDDQYYVDTFGAEMWRQEGGNTYPDPSPHTPLTPQTVLPFPDAELFFFDKALQPECALLIRRDGGILMTCDAIQHYGDFRHTTWFMRWIMPLMGFPKTTILGPLWLKFLTPEGDSLEDEFRQLLGLQFDKLLSAHGSLLETNAHAAVEAAIDKAFQD